MLGICFFTHSELGHFGFAHLLFGSCRVLTVFHSGFFQISRNQLSVLRYYLYTPHLLGDTLSLLILTTLYHHHYHHYTAVVQGFRYLSVLASCYVPYTAFCGYLSSSRRVPNSGCWLTCPVVLVYILLQYTSLSPSFPVLHICGTRLVNLQQAPRTIPNILCKASKGHELYYQSWSRSFHL